jgi:hypothetical protein
MRGDQDSSVHNVTGMYIEQYKQPSTQLLYVLAQSLDWWRQHPDCCRQLQFHVRTRQRHGLPAQGATRHT